MIHKNAQLAAQSAEAAVIIALLAIGAWKFYKNLTGKK
jgi:hypothetical protein